MLGQAAQPVCKVEKATFAHSYTGVAGCEADASEVILAGTGTMAWARWKKRKIKTGEKSEAEKNEKEEHSQQ